ncbi:MAG: argininosuccinate lyase [Pseudomonadota bacterium]
MAEPEQKDDEKADDLLGMRPQGIRKGRFSGGMDPLFARFNSSVSFDRRMYEQDIRGSIAHVRMLGRQGIVTSEEASIIEQGLTEVLADIRDGCLVFRDDLEDVHINVEHALKQKIGDVAGKLHTARSRNDQVALDFRLYVREQTELGRRELVCLLEALTGKAEETIDIIMPGYTHLQRAQPVRLGHHVMAYFEMFRRDWERYGDALKRSDESPLGAAALAGTTFPVDREFTAKELGFSRVSSNSIDSVSDRDFAVEFIFVSSLVMMHLSRLAEELIIWSSQEFGFCVLPDAFCSGSSIMPQKKNPDACELIRGKTGRVYGALMSILTMLKGLPLAYNKDLQEDKEPLFDCADTVLGSVGIMAGLIPGIRFRGGRMRKAASDPALAATDMADRLARDGVPFREAHELVGAAVRDKSALKGQVGIPTPEEMVEARNQTGGTARAQVMERIANARVFLEGIGRS